MADRQPRVLIVEDNPMNMTLMETILEANGFEYLSATDGESGVELAAQNDLDLVLMDLQMPGIDGYEAMRQIRQLDRHASLPIIAVTGNTTSVDASQAIDAGFNDFLAKPFRIDDLLSVIERVR